MSARDYGFAVDLANTMNWHMSAEDFGFNQFLEPKGCLILFNDSIPVGIASCVSFGKVGWFGNLVVKQEWRGQGVGRLLLEHAICYLQGKGVESIGLYAYPEFREFYSKFGFKKDIDLSVMYSNHLHAIRASSKVECQADFSVLGGFDSEFFGTDRSRLLKGILQEKTSVCHVSFRGEDVVGYVLAKVYGNLAEVGPLVCRSDKSDVALELLKAALRGLINKSVMLYVPQNQSVFEEFLLSVGFRKSFSVSRMFLGKSKIQNYIHLAESLERG
jgi:hypothetical protein